MTMASKSWRTGLSSVFLTMAYLLAVLPTPLAAQVSPEEHAQHHPDQAKGNGEANRGGMMGGGGKGMMGGGMGGMMEKMGAPKPKEMYPKLMSLPDLPMEERAKIEHEAHQRMLDGTKLLSAGLDGLATAAGTDDFRSMQDATAKMREGLAQFESGLAAHRAIVEGKAPRNVALQWFKREMNLLPSAHEETGYRIFGMTLFHSSIMALLVAFAAVMIWMYFFKMQRATALMERLATVNRPTEATTTVAAVPASATAETVASIDIAKSSRGADAKAPAVAGDCCADTEVECVSEGALGDRADISQGILRIAKRKLCRLRVARIYQETSGVKTFRLVACHGGALPFNYYPGQFLTLTLPTAEKPIRRSYTISSSPTQGYYCEITVKREDQGVGSRYLHDSVKENDTLEVQAPSGKFIFTGNEANSVVLIGGGVGITPMMSIVRALTDMAYQGDIYLVVACRDPEHFIFGKELKELKKRHLNLHMFAAMSRIKKPIDDCYAGRLSKELLAEWIPDIASTWIHLCGAPAMMEATKQMLTDLGVPVDMIHTENFGSQQKPHAKVVGRKDVAASAQKQTAATVNFAGSGKSTPLLPDETLLEAGERIGVDIDYSCRTGMCGVCTVKLASGEVEMEVEDGLEPDDKANGMVLACQAKSTSDVTVEA